jgi:thiol-disulfide isomerase/thioredoxin
MKNKSVFLVVFFLFAYGCKKTEKQTTIKGNIPNLPDGTVYLFKDYPGNRIDSTKSKNGIFTLAHQWENNEPVYIGIDHIDKNGVNRFFSFTTKAKYKGVPGWGTSVFLSDSNIIMNGDLKYNTYIGITFPDDKKPVTGPPLITGRQTEAYYNIDGDLFENINQNTFKIVKEKLGTYPDSYHLLYKIGENKNSFSAQQFEDFLKLFKGEITQSDTYKKLYAYNQKRFNEKKISVPLLENDKGARTKIIDPKYKKHLIIFWASWCGPCREEIPLLKKMYPLYNNETEFISISIDNDKLAWQKALKQENMIWKQLFVGDTGMDHEALQIHFKLNQAIPYTILIDDNMKMLSSSTGLSNEENLKKLINK